MGEELTSKEFKDSDIELKGIVTIFIERKDLIRIVPLLQLYSIPHFYVIDFFSRFTEVELEYMPEDPETIEEVEAWWPYK